MTTPVPYLPSNRLWKADVSTHSIDEITRKYACEIEIDVNEYVIRAIDNIRGSAKAIPLDKSKYHIACVFKCDLCGWENVTTSGYAPLFCNRCGRRLIYGEVSE